jgi:hypothetical protein
MIITLIFEKNANFFAENCQKSPKIVIITTPDATAKKSPKMRTNPLFWKLKHNFFREKDGPIISATSAIFTKNTQRKQSSDIQKFSQSGHPVDILSLMHSHNICSRPLQKKSFECFFPIQPSIALLSPGANPMTLECTVTTPAMYV